MKYNDFKIFKFSTISKNINLIKDGFSRIYKKIKNITGNIADSLSYILKGIFSIIHKNTKTIPGNIVKFLSYISKYIFSEINKSMKFVIYNFLKVFKLICVLSLNPIHFFCFILCASPSLAGVANTMFPFLFNIRLKDFIICSNYHSFLLYTFFLYIYGLFNDGNIRYNSWYLGR